MMVARVCQVGRCILYCIDEGYIAFYVSTLLTPATDQESSLGVGIPRGSLQHTIILFLNDTHDISNMCDTIILIMCDTIILIMCVAHDISNMKLKSFVVVGYHSAAVYCIILWSFGL